MTQKEGACGDVTYFSSSVKSYFHSSPATRVLGAGQAWAEPMVSHPAARSVSAWPTAQCRAPNMLFIAGSWKKASV